MTTLSDFRLSMVKSPVLQPQVASIDYDLHNATFNSSSFELCEEGKESGAEVPVEQGKALGIEY